MVAVKDRKTGEVIYHRPPYTKEEEDRLYKGLGAAPRRMFISPQTRAAAKEAQQQQQEAPRQPPVPSADE